MTPAARISAAIEVIADIEARRRPATDALRDWGVGHRFAGSGDRAAIAGLVYDALRRKASAAFLMGSDSARAVVLGMLRLARGMDVAAIDKLADGGRFAPQPLSAAERAALTAGSLDGAPPYVRGDYPDWLDPHLEKTFGDARAEEGAALASRATLDLRVNTLKGTRADALARLDHLGAVATPWSPVGLRLDVPPSAKSPPVQSEPAFLEGLIEIQDEGSQLAALLADAKSGETVIDLCAGGGGKALALAAAMDNAGRIFATDLDIRRLAPIHDRIARAGATNVEVRTPRDRPGAKRGEGDALADLQAQADLVLIDAPCTGTGVWRRNPDAKWRIRPGALEQRVKEQAEILDRAAGLAKPGGRIVYITCSVLTEENGEQMRAFVGRHAGWSLVPPAEVVAVLGARADAFRAAALVFPEGLQMTPRRTGTDGFFVAVLRRA